MRSSRRLPAHLSPRPVRAVRRALLARRCRQSAAAYLAANRGLAVGATLLLVLAVVINVLMAGHALTWDGFVDVRPATR